ncbi:ATP-binding protein [Pedobacter gandavensis]|uniref:ATP-binding protein n=1 Tax=Pedobacter gandavensis TaxID=2679963 RepID=UPI00247A5108|nr:ATP-binding protein [Pedobacter gandavensis]WGQ10620.1 ATP-binding protein [Pedobacter gandavensis]
MKDTGLGMDQSFQEKLFDNFSQEDASITRKHGGTGLGMSITKKLIELMNGKIEVDSKKKQRHHHFYSPGTHQRES